MHSSYAPKKKLREVDVRGLAKESRTLLFDESHGHAIGRRVFILWLFQAGSMRLSLSRRYSWRRGAARGAEWVIVRARREMSLEQIIESLQLVLNECHALFQIRHIALAHDDIGRRFTGFL